MKHVGIYAESVARSDAALEAIRSEKFDAIVLDLLLPAVTGLEIIRKLNETHPHLLRRVIVLTAISESALAGFAYQPLLWDLIRKPFDIDRLTRSLMRCIAFHAAPRRPLHSDLSDWLRQRSTNAIAGIVALLRGLTLELQAAFGARTRVAESFFPLSLSAPFPICMAARSGRAIWLTAERDSADYPFLAPMWNVNKSAAIAALPMMQNGRVIGAMGWSFAEQQRFDEWQQTYFLDLTRQVAAATP